MQTKTDHPRGMFGSAIQRVRNLKKCVVLKIQKGNNFIQIFQNGLTPCYFLSIMDSMKIT